MSNRTGNLTNYLVIAYIAHGRANMEDFILLCPE